MTDITLEVIFTAEDFYIDKLSVNTPHSTYWAQRFAEDKFKALYELGFDVELKSADKTPSFNFLYFIAERFVEFLTGIPEIELVRGHLQPTVPDDIRYSLLNSIPFALGSEFITEDWLNNIFTKLTDIFNQEISSYEGLVAKYFSEKRQDLKIPERVFFHLVENKKDVQYPFAFLATYATTDKNGRVKHVPISYAMKEFKKNQQKLLTLLACLNKAAEVSPLINSFIDSGEMLRPLKLTSNEAHEILKTIPDLEAIGILCRIPNWWKRRYVRMSVKFEQGSKAMLGLNTLLTMVPELNIDGVALNRADIKDILQQTEGLALIKGKWIEVNKERLQKLLDEMDSYSGERSFLDAMRMKAGMSDQNQESDITFSNEDFLGNMMKKISNSDEIKKPKVPASVSAQLRPYQLSGYAWLNLMSELGLGACLADDMGLGKTLQVLTFLEELRNKKNDARILLIVPASLIGNWENEAAKFTPEMPLHILHGRNKAILSRELTDEPLSFLTITTYTTATGLEGLQKINWDAVILDEAQAIKNAGTKQSKEIKKIPALLKIAMTGTPVENNLSNLWSLFDFLNKGLLGTADQFKRYSNSITDTPEGYKKLRNIVSPFILRRLKTDKNIISDLPDKIEQIDYVTLSKKQIVLYHKQVEELEEAMKDMDDFSEIRRSGVILTTIMKLKQICNHPDQFLGLESYAPSDSGKFAMLKEICETIHEKREKVLIFTQYKEIISYLADYLGEIFHAEGLVIHGETKVKKRTEIVEAFNNSTENPFIILSLKAGGVGLNLTRANHVIHFDRWWNPAVENQATDRAFRIGQTKNVMVHKFVAKGTIEDRINDIIESKKSLAESIIGSGENWITELSNQEILSMMKLDI